MMKNQKFYVCGHCGNVAALAVSSGVNISCCGEKMAELVPNTVDASREKHVPSVTKTAGGITVRVGDTAHPMEEKHYIGFVYAETKNGGQKKRLRAGDEPVAVFSFADDEPVAVYAYCNIHGLWVSEL
jgi:superoxide reductase